MRAFILGAAFALVATGAMAQYQPYSPYGQTRPSTTSTYDWRSGNRYTTTTNEDGSATVRGNNYQTGARWKSTIEEDGQQSGTDADGNRWRYNPDTKTYRNFGTGQVCRGEGSRRVCL